MSCSIAEEEHVGVVFPPEAFESANDGDGVKWLSVEDGVLGEVMVDLIESEGDDSFVVDGFVVFFAGICHLPPDIIIDNEGQINDKQFLNAITNFDKRFNNLFGAWKYLEYVRFINFNILSGNMHLTTSRT